MPKPIRFLIADLTLRIPLADHTTNENRIKRSRLEWTIVRPGGLTDGDKTDRMRHGFEDMKMKGNQNISRTNVAAFIIGQLGEIIYLNICVWLFES